MTVKLLPLKNTHIIVTRASAQASAFSQLLKSRGAIVHECPTIRIVPLKNSASFQNAIQNLHTFDWAIFTSSNAAEVFQKQIKKFPKKLRVFAIGPATAQTLKKLNLPVHKISKEFIAESILDALKTIKNKKILIPQSELSRDILNTKLSQKGAEVHAIKIYKTLPDLTSKKKLETILLTQPVHCVAFTSSSTAINFFAMLSVKTKKILKDKKICAASIGPITTQTLKKQGWETIIAAQKPTTKYLAKAIENFYKPSN